MDPNANFRERIELASAGEQHSARYRELESAYAAWRGFGGFPADRALRDDLHAVLAVRKVESS